MTGAEEEGVVLDEEILSYREVCQTGTEHV